MLGFNPPALRPVSRIPLVHLSTPWWLKSASLRLAWAARNSFQRGTGGQLIYD